MLLPENQFSSGISGWDGADHLEENRRKKDKSEKQRVSTKIFIFGVSKFECVLFRITGRSLMRTLLFSVLKKSSDGFSII